ncbi:hypothetical protein JB92DRAFT_2717169, partial [Gautieria morchelliformis]
GKLDDEDKKTILAAVKDATDWIDANEQGATADDLEEKLFGGLLSLSPTYLGLGCDNSEGAMRGIVPSLLLHPGRNPNPATDLERKTRS